MLFNLFKSLEEKIEDDKRKVIKRLKSSDIKTLVIEMDNINPISKNIIEKRKRFKSWDSGEDVSYFAHKLSSELNDKSLKPVLIEMLNDENYLKYKVYVYRCLSSLCQNTSDYELFDFLIAELQDSGDEILITNVLSRLKDLKKAKALNIDYLKELLLFGTKENRIAAIRALANCEHDDIEELLIKLFNTSNNDIKSEICDTLRSVGTIKSIESLNAAFKKTRSGHIRYMISNVLEYINKREGINQ